MVNRKKQISTSIKSGVKQKTIHEYKYYNYCGKAYIYDEYKYIEDSASVVQPMAKTTTNYLTYKDKMYILDRTSYNYVDSQWQVCENLNITYDTLNMPNSTSLWKYYNKKLVSQHINKKTFNKYSQISNAISYIIDSNNTKIENNFSNYHYADDNTISYIDIKTLDTNKNIILRAYKQVYLYNDRNQNIDESFFRYDTLNGKFNCTRKCTYSYDSLNAKDSIYTYSTSNNSSDTGLIPQSRSIINNIPYNNSFVIDSLLIQHYNNQWVNNSLKVLQHDTYFPDETNNNQDAILFNATVSKDKIITLKALKDQGNVRISIFDVSGHTYYNYNSESVTENSFINSIAMPNARAYFVSIKSESGNQLIKLITD